MTDGKLRLLSAERVEKGRKGWTDVTRKASAVLESDEGTGCAVLSGDFTGRGVCPYQSEKGQVEILERLVSEQPGI